MKIWCYLPYVVALIKRIRLIYEADVAIKFNR